MARQRKRKTAICFVLSPISTIFAPVKELEQARMAADFNIRQERVSPADKDFENALRPLRFSDFSGQRKVVENLEVFVEAAKYRGEPLDHTLLHGPP